MSGAWCYLLVIAAWGGLTWCAAEIVVATYGLLDRAVEHAIGESLLPVVPLRTIVWVGSWAIFVLFAEIGWSYIKLMVQLGHRTLEAHGDQLLKR